MGTGAIEAIGGEIALCLCLWAGAFLLTAMRMFGVTRRNGSATMCGGGDGGGCPKVWITGDHFEICLSVFFFFFRSP